MDFIPFGTNKAKGLKEYQNQLGIRPEECVVFGDEYNDIEMLKAVPPELCHEACQTGSNRGGILYGRKGRTNPGTFDPGKWKNRGGNLKMYKKESVEHF